MNEEKKPHPAQITLKYVAIQNVETGNRNSGLFFSTQDSQTWAEIVREAQRKLTQINHDNGKLILFGIGMLIFESGVLKRNYFVDFQEKQLFNLDSNGEDFLVSFEEQYLKQTSTSFNQFDLFGLTINTDIPT